MVLGYWRSSFLGILTPFFIGFLFAYILNFPYKLLHDRAFKKMGTKHKFLQGLKKPLAIIITYVGCFAIIAALIICWFRRSCNNLSNLVQISRSNLLRLLPNDVKNWMNQLQTINSAVPPKAFHSEEMMANAYSSSLPAVRI